MAVKRQFLFAAEHVFEEARSAGTFSFTHVRPEGVE